MSPITQIKKRSGEVVQFDTAKIAHAIKKAFTSVGNDNFSLIENLSEQVLNVLNNKFEGKGIPSVEDIQDIVEIILIHNDLPQVAKSYIIYRQNRAQARDRQKQILNGLSTSLPYTENALKVMAKRYLQKDANDKVIEIPEQMMDRVAGALAAVEKRYGKTDAEVENYKKDFYEVLSRFEFTPAGRTMTNAGTELPVVANCIVLNIEDSMESIFGTLKDAALLQQQGSGLGFPFHTMRPAGDKTRRSRGVASGPISFLRVYNRAFGVIKQQNRHGANMAVMSVEHPDILEFVHCKAKEGDIKNFNISVGLTNRFMKAVDSEDPNPWKAVFKGKDYNPRRIYRDENDTIVDVKEEVMTAKELFQEIISAAWSNGEPGCVFLDKVNETNPLPGLGRIEACNPCGEQFLHDGDVCNLGSINLERFVDDNGTILWKRLEHSTRAAVRMLDNVIDITEYSADKVNKVSRENRRIGLGIMGFADMLYKMEVGYDTEEGFATAEKVMGFIDAAAHKMSQELAEEKGVFPNYDKSIYAPKGIKMRNAALTNIAPTGTISMMFDISGGVEPYFALAYHYKNVLGGDVDLTYINKHLKAALEKAGVFTQDVMDRIVNEGSLQNIAEIPEHIKRIYVTSMDISAESHIRMQAAFQKNCDNAISKTINFRFDASKDDVMNGYIMAWKAGCKGCTVYRDGSRQLQVLNLNKDKKAEEPKDPNAGRDIEQSQVGGVSVPTVGVTNTIISSFGKKEVIASGKCPDCGEQVHISEGCYTCVACGSSACSI